MAVLRMGEGGGCAVTVDLLSDHVDFELTEVDVPAWAARLGREPERSGGHGHVSAGGGHRPMFTADGAFELAVELYEGLLPLAAEYDLAIAGGDTNTWDGPLVLSITALGQITPRGPLRRSGARPGDRILATGHFGGSVFWPPVRFPPPCGRIAPAEAERFASVRLFSVPSGTYGAGLGPCHPASGQLDQ